MALVVVTGVPGSGKSTLAGALATRLDLPLIAKDRFKEILFDALGVSDVAWSQKLGQAAIALQYEAMRTVQHAVVDSALWTDRSEPDLEALGLPMVQVYCECPFELARQRFFERLTTGQRHPGFREDEMTTEEFERFRPLTEPLRLSAPLVRVDTTTAVDIKDVVARLTMVIRERATRSSGSVRPSVPMTDLARFEELVPLDHGLCVVVTRRHDQTPQTTVVNAGVLAHPITRDRCVGFVAAGGARKLANLRTDPTIAVVIRAGWQWVTVEGDAELIGLDDPHADIDDEGLRLLLRDTFSAAGGTHDDWDAYDRTMREERRTAVLIAPRRVYSNPD